MPRFFVPSESIADGLITVIGDDARHISRSLRMKVGERVTVCDPLGVEYNCVISAFTSESVELSVTSSQRGESEPPYRAVVYQALVRSDRFDTVIQKSVEFGASMIVPVTTARSAVKLSPSDGEKKLVRWRRIAEEAAKQCGRSLVPELLFPIPFERAITDAEGQRLFCYEEERTLKLTQALHNAENNGVFSLFIGPEGGFSPEEAALAASSGALSVSLGRRILRTESAAPFVLACLSYAFEL